MFEDAYVIICDNDTEYPKIVYLAETTGNLVRIFDSTAPLPEPFDPADMRASRTLASRLTEAPLSLDVNLDILPRQKTKATLFLFSGFWITHKFAGVDVLCLGKAHDVYKLIVRAPDVSETKVYQGVQFVVTDHLEIKVLYRLDDARYNVVFLGSGSGVKYIPPLRSRPPSLEIKDKFLPYAHRALSRECPLERRWTWKFMDVLWPGSFRMRVGCEWQTIKISEAGTIKMSSQHSNGTPGYLARFDSEGKPVGSVKCWYDNGKTRYIIPYDTSGRRHGVVRAWRRSGKLYYSASYVEGVMQETVE